MDPASIFSIIAGSAGLALQCGKLIRDVHDVTDMYKNANLTIVSLSTGLETIQWAWQRIQAILETWTDDQVRAGQDLDTDTFHQLDRSLKGGRIVIAALEKDLMPLAGGSAQEHGAGTGSKILNRVQMIWNATALREHQERIRDQMNSMNLMISVLKLPDANSRQQTLNANVSVLRKSDESAYTIVPSRLSALTPSIWSHEDGSVISEASESSLVYRELAFDDDLFTARVYKRNYRGREVREVKLEIKDEDSPNETPTTLAVSTTTSNAPRTGVSHSSSATDVFELPVTSSPLIQYQPLLTTGSHWVITGWITPDDTDDDPVAALKPYIGIPGPTVPRIFFEEQCLSEWRTNHEGYLKLDDEYVIKKIDWRRLFETSVRIPPQWLHHCLMAACIVGGEDLMQLILRKDPALRWKPSYRRCYRYRYPIEVAFRQGHIHIVKMLLRLNPSAMDSLHQLGRFMIRRALRKHDNELLAEVLMQDAFNNEQICDDQKHVVRLDHQNGSQTCLGSLIEASANLRILENPDRSAFRYLAFTLPPDAVIVARLPLSVGERRKIIRTIIMNEALVRCSHHGFEWHLAYDTAVQGIADYLMLQDGLIHVGELGVETYSCLINTLESHFPEIVRRPGIMASLEAMQRPQPTTSLEANLALSPRGAGTDAILSSRRKKISRLFVGQSTTGPPIDQNKTNSVKSDQAPDLTEGCLGPLQREKTRGFAVLEKQRRLIPNISLESSRKELIDKYEFSRYVRYQL